MSNSLTTNYFNVRKTRKTNDFNNILITNKRIYVFSYSISVFLVEFKTRLS